MTIENELYGKIRRCHRQGLSMRRTAEILNVSRHTVKRYWEGAHTPDDRKNYPQALESEHKAMIMEALREYFEECRKAGYSKKQQPNAKTAWVALRDRFQIGESTIRRYVRELKANMHAKGFIPLSFEPGEVMQVDWCEIKACIKGHIYKAPVFCAVLPYSYAIFAMVMPDMKTPSLMEGHIRAFEYYNGVVERVFYDNLRTAVNSGYGKHAVKQEQFKLLEAHYAYEAVFMNAYSGWEKGAVENLCQLIRGVAFTPMPHADSLKDIQQEVLRRCVDYRKFHKVKDRVKPVAVMYEEERGNLSPLPVKPFDAYGASEALVGTDLTFRHNGVKYSLPYEFAGKTITVRSRVYDVEAWHKGALVYRHERAFGKGENQYIPEHYLPLLEKKARALENAAPLKYGVVPPELDAFRKKCMAKNKYEQLAQILLLGQSTDAALLLQAVDYANRTALPTIDKVRLYLSLHQNADGAQFEDSVKVDALDLSAYDDLLKGGDEEDD